MSTNPEIPTGRELLPELEHFLPRANNVIFSEHTLEYVEGAWAMRLYPVEGAKSASYLSVVSFEDLGVWSLVNWNRIEGSYVGDEWRISHAIDLLAKALACPRVPGQFQPRGPQHFIEGQWSYHSTLNGNIAEFHGYEEVTYNRSELRDKEGKPDKKHEEWWRTILQGYFRGGLLIPK